MKLFKLFCLFFLLSGAVMGQGTPSASKIQYKNGVAIGSKDSSSFAANDSLFLTIDRNGRLMWRGNGTNAPWKVVAYTDNPDFILNQSGSNLSAQTAKFYITDTAWANILRATSHVRTDSIAASTALRVSGTVGVPNAQGFASRLTTGTSATIAGVSNLDTATFGSILISSLIQGSGVTKFKNYTSGARQEMPDKNGVIALVGDTTGLSTKFINNQAGGNLSAQPAKYQINDTARSTGVVRGGSIYSDGIIQGMSGNFLVNGNGIRVGTSTTAAGVVNLKYGTTPTIAGSGFGSISYTNRDTLTFNAVRDPLLPAAANIIMDSIADGINRYYTLPNASGTLALTSDTTTLSNRINQKLNISDTAAMKATITLDKVLANGNTTGRSINSIRGIITDWPASNTFGNGPFYTWNDNTASRAMALQLNTNYGLDILSRNSSYSKVGEITSTGGINLNDSLVTLTGIRAVGGATLGGALNGTSAVLTGNVTANNSIVLTNRSQSTNIWVGNSSTTTSITGNWNTSVGGNTMPNITTGDGNTAIGNGALFSLSGSESANIGIGRNAGSQYAGGGSNSGITRSIYIGNDTKAAASGQTNQIVIGDSTTGYGSNTMTLGNTNITTTRIRGNIITPGTLTLGGAFNSSVSTDGDFANIIANTSSGTGAFSTMYISNDGTGAGALAFGAVGTGNTVGGIFPQDGAVLYAGTNLSGGLSLGTRANAAAKIYTNATLAQTWNTDQTTTLSSLGTGTVYSNSGTLTNTNPSDFRIKNTVKPLNYGLAQILQLQPKSFYYNSDTAKKSLKYGFIAQEVKQVMPDMVRAIKGDTLGLETDGIYVTMVKAIQEQQLIIEAQGKQIADLIKSVNALKGIIGEANLRKTRM